MSATRRSTTEPGEVLGFWFAEGDEERWFNVSPDFDREIAERFGAAHEDAAAGRLAGWEATPEGALALVIVLDQFPRNMFRESPKAFATDPLACAVAERAIEHGHDMAMPEDRRIFFYMPFEHAEDLALQHRCCELVRARCNRGKYVEFADRHCAVIARFGRFPHRNEALGRESTPEEIEYLEGRDELF
jgi:uncharacterized protein (DUF924 family)